MDKNNDFLEARNKIFGGLSFEDNKVVSYMRFNGYSNNTPYQFDFNIPYDLVNGCDVNLLINKIDDMANTIKGYSSLYSKWIDNQGRTNYREKFDDKFKELDIVYHDFYGKGDKLQKAEALLDNAFNKVLSDKNTVIYDDKDFLKVIMEEMKKENLKNTKLYLREDGENHIEPCIMDANGNTIPIDLKSNTDKYHDILSYADKIEIMSGVDRFATFAENNNIDDSKTLVYDGKEYTFSSINEMIKSEQKNRLESRFRSPRFTSSIEHFVAKPNAYDSLTKKQQELVDNLEKQARGKGVRVKSGINKGKFPIYDKSAKYSQVEFNRFISEMKELGVYKGRVVAKSKAKSNDNERTL